jgi:uncharacterized protein
MRGGLYLCYVGVEKLAHKLFHSRAEDEAHHAELIRAAADPSVDLVAFERDKIQGAIRTDLVLSAEIIAITLGAVAKAPLGTQVAVLTAVSALMTVGVYGFVAGIVKLDDLGLYLRRGGAAARAIGAGILRAAPWLMKGLSVAGTAAMFLVGGDILTHGVPPVQHGIERASRRVGEIEGVGGVLESITPAILDGIAGVIAGAVTLVAVVLVKRVVPRRA